MVDKLLHGNNHYHNTYFNHVYKWITEEMDQITTTLIYSVLSFAAKLWVWPNATEKEMGTSGCEELTSQRIYIFFKHLFVRANSIAQMYVCKGECM